uniref:Mesoderm posterior ba n=1 Tax=Gouania willdenowi TaxID=441366 RepID=A0A8C5D5S8_GOUWI
MRCASLVPAAASMLVCIENYNQSPTNLSASSLKSSPCSLSGRGRTMGRKSRSKYPSKKRHNASEREKLRMRDLTKALNHLRTYLPPSVAPAGQTLTKIETLRLTIRYISYLSAQLGLSEDVLDLLFAFHPVYNI